MTENIMELAPMIVFRMSGRKFMDLRTCDVYYESDLKRVEESFFYKNMVSLYLDMDDDPEFVHVRFLVEIDPDGAEARGRLLRMIIAIN
jgi:hypothetical protein